MAISDLHLNLSICLRWLHVLAGILWLGQLYFLDFMFLPLLRTLNELPENAALRQLMRRGSWWLRWSAMTSLASGIFLFVMSYFYAPGTGLGPTPLLIANNQITDRSMWILFGMAGALVMWFNVWFAIWPAQKQLLFMKNNKPDQVAILQGRSQRAVRTNTLLSGPVLFAMLAPSHYGSIDLKTWMIVIALGTLAMWVLTKVSKALNRRGK